MSPVHLKQWLLCVFALLVFMTASAQQLPVYTNWENYTTLEGMPDNSVLSVAVDAGRIWAGTRRGLVLIESRQIKKVFTSKDGLVNDVVTAITPDRKTGDLWISTFGGLSRYSGGEFQSYTNLNSGLANDIVFDVGIQDEYVWAATAAGISRLNIHTGEWSIYNEGNLPVQESIVNGITVAKQKVFFAMWGGGVLGYDIASERWDTYLKVGTGADSSYPAGRTAFTNFVTSVAYMPETNTIWVASHFGLRRLDRNRSWHHYDRSAKDFSAMSINAVKPSEHGIWLCTEGGLILFDPGLAISTTYRANDGRLGGNIAIKQAGKVTKTIEISTSIASNEVLSAALDGNEIWVATSSGLSHGMRREGSTAIAHLNLHTITNTVSPDIEHAENNQVRLSVNIGFLAPADNGVPSHGLSMLQGAQLAIDEANAAGGFFVKGNAISRPYALKVHSDSLPWGAATTEIVKMALDEKVVGVLGSFDDNVSEIMLRVASDLELPVVNTASTDPALTRSGIRWLLHNFPDDRQQSRALANYIIEEAGLKRIGVLLAPTHDARVGIREFSRQAACHGHAPVLELELGPDDPDSSVQLRKIKDAKVEALVLWMDSLQAARLLKQLRTMQINPPVFGPSRLADPTLIEAAGPISEGVVAITVMNPTRSDPLWRKFEQKYRMQFSVSPDAYAAYSYDGMNMLIKAIEKAGLDGRRIRDALYDYRTNPYVGASGQFQFDANLSNISPLGMVRVEGGVFTHWRPHFGPECR